MKNSPVLYIASNGRSGSTLLEMILNNFQNVWTMGEVYVLPWELKEKIGQCGCGEKIDRCGFWQSVAAETKDVLDTKGKISLFRDSYRISGYFKPAQWLNILIRKRVGDKKGLERFCRDHQKLFSVIQKKATAAKGEEIRYLVDSSKNQYRLFWLLNCDGIETRVIHIVKDPRAFIYSWVKTEKNLLRKLMKTWRMGLRYLFENHLIEKCVSSLTADRHLFIRYEDLASNPGGTTEKIAAWLGVPSSPKPAEEFREQPNHGIAGNKMRGESRGIFLDEKWKTGLPPFLRGLTISITRSLAKKYRYL